MVEYDFSTISIYMRNIYLVEKFKRLIANIKILFFYSWAPFPIG